jgi:hypothetical protein
VDGRGCGRFPARPFAVGFGRFRWGVLVLGAVGGGGGNGWGTRARGSMSRANRPAWGLGTAPARVCPSRRRAVWGGDRLGVGFGALQQPALQGGGRCAPAGRPGVAAAAVPPSFCAFPHRPPLAAAAVAAWGHARRPTVVPYVGREGERGSLRCVALRCVRVRRRLFVSSSSCRVIRLRSWFFCLGAGG